MNNSIISKKINKKLPQMWERVLEDPRKYAKRWSFPEIMTTVMKGMLGGCKTLRELEFLTCLSGRRIPDSTIRDVLVEIDPEPLEEELARGVREANRQHELDHKELPIKLTVIDGKNISTTKKDANEYSLKRTNQGGTTYLHHALRAFHASSTVKLLMGQMFVPKGTNESGVLKFFIEKLVGWYGRTNLLQVFSMDAGFTSIANAKVIVENKLSYIFAVKDPRVHVITQAAIRLLGSKTKPNYFEKERDSGKDITRNFYRCKVSNVNGWEHATEVWRVQKIVVSRENRTEENHYYVTNLPIETLSNKQALKTVRFHWNIENNANWVCDVAWKEDTKPWCNQALELLSLIRMISYNLVSSLKLRTLKKTNSCYWTWENTLNFIKTILFPFKISINGSVGI